MMVTLGWLGGKQRAQDTTSLILMGQRLYNTVTGLFTSVDPVPGGNTTDYAYPQDPINQYDLNGLFALRTWIKRGIAIAGAGAAIACIVATAGVCLGVSVAVTIVSAGSNFYGAAKKETSWRAAIGNTLLDTVALKLPAVRNVGKVGRHAVMPVTTKLVSKASASLTHVKPAVKKTATATNALRYRTVVSTSKAVAQIANAGRGSYGVR